MPLLLFVSLSMSRTGAKKDEANLVAMSRTGSKKETKCKLSHLWIMDRTTSVPKSVLHGVFIFVEAGLIGSRVGT